MPTDKDFKRLVRGRMQKTGESYTAARSHLIRTRSKKTPSLGGQTVAAFSISPKGDVAKAVTPRASDYATLAGMSDAKVKTSTGCTWESWVKALDYAGAHAWPHREIARYVHEKFKVPSWWTQTVTVGYERIKGLRAIGQRRDGGFTATKSRTVAVPLSRLYRAFRDSRSRARWLPGVDLTIRSTTKEKSMRIAWPDGSIVLVGFLGKGRSKSQVALEHANLPDQAAADRFKVFWGERLDVLKDQLV